MSRVIVVLPLKKGAFEQMRELLAKGPPFDPGEVALDLYQVFLTSREAVFVLEASTQSLLERLVADPGWAGIAAWQDHVAGPARAAEDAYSWARTHAGEAGLSFAPTPGPGDSDGGDVYPP